MAAYRVFDPNPVFWNLLATEPLRAGWIQFYEIGGTTTPKDTWSDPDLTVLNSNPIVLDGGGRFTVNVFGDGDYRMVAFDRFGAQQWERDIISGQSAGQTIPALEVDEFLTNDGANLLWRAIRQMPDPTGSSGQVPVTNGAGYTLQNLPAANTSAITFPTGGIKISNGTTAWMLQRGSGTVPANGASPVNNVAVAFGTAFSAPPTVVTTINGGPGVSNPGGGIPSSGVTAVSTTGFVFNVDTNAFGSTVNLQNPTPFYWFAIGTVAP
jgi:hypothetical protein